jgi:hypothetical protein
MEEEKTILVPNKANFSLEKVKLTKTGGLDVHYSVNEKLGAEFYSNKYHIMSSKDVHPDLRKLFSKLNPIVARVFNMDSFVTEVIESAGFDATDMQKELARDYAEACVDRISVRGISISGKDENQGVTIAGVYETDELIKTSICTPKINYATEVFGFESELEDIVFDIEDEVYQYLFEGKKAQLELFGDAVKQ